MAQQVDFTRIDEDVVTRACQVLDLLCRRGMSVVTAESCTGGLIATVLSEAPGANEHLHGGFVVYTKPNKTAALGVPADVLAREGAVCRTVVCAMAEGALQRSPADVAVAITGVAGPEPDDDGNPVGLVHLAIARRGFPPLHEVRNFGDVGRAAVRYRAVTAALELLEQVLRHEGRATSPAE
ncbi:MAG: CinA family protein [Xanthobacteraceae bacterium]